MKCVTYKNNLCRASKRTLYVTLTALLSFSYLSGGVKAIPLKWTPNIDPFVIIGGDTVTVSGSFVYDADAMLFSNVDIIVSGVTVNNPGDLTKASTSLNGQYTLVGGGSNNVNLLAVKDLDGNGVDEGDASIRFGFNTFPHLSSAGGTTDIISTDLRFCFSGGVFCNGFRLGGIGGTITASAPGVSIVPLPTALPLFGTGLAIMGFMGWRLKRKVAEAA